METIQTAGFLFSAAASYIAFLYKLFQVRRSWRDSAYVTLIITLALQCLTFTMGAISATSETFLGIRNFAILMMHLTAVAFCVTAQVLLLQWANPISKVRRTIRHWLLAGLVLNVLLVVLFFIGDAPNKPRNALAVGSDEPAILVYLLLFMVSQAIPCITIFRQCLPYARSAAKPWLRRGLRLLAGGAVVLFLYCVTRTINVLTPLVGIDPGRWQILPSLLSATGIAILSVSLTMPSWGVYVSNIAEWGRNYLSYRALYPLWSSLYEVSPDIALEPPTSSVSDLHYRLHRRVVEIRDGWRALRPYMDTTDSAGPSSEHMAVTTPRKSGQAATEAMKIKKAIDMKKAGLPPESTPEFSGFDDRDATSFAAEVAWLKEVSLAYERIRR